MTDPQPRFAVLALVLVRVLVLLLPVLLAAPASGAAEKPAENPGDQPPYSNLQVLPADTPKAVLMETMKGFSFALGVRCSHCHVGEPQQSLAEYDFASDDKPAKAAARVMLEMVRRINGEHLDRLPARSGLSVTCATCHHGKTRPETLADALLAAHAEGGAKAAVERYRLLRERYFGRWHYDFGERSLLEAARRLEAAGDLPATRAMLDLNLEHHPESFLSHFGVGEVLRQQGDEEAAVTAYRRALELRPDMPPAKRRLQELGVAMAEGDDP